MSQQALTLAVFLLLGTFFLSSCDESGKYRTLPRHSGEPGEVLLVMDEGKWLGEEGDSLRVFLEEFVRQLPQAEPSFDLLQFSPAEMSNLLRQHRNIIEIEIGPDAEGKNKVTLSKDVWSNGQLVFRAYANSKEEWFDLVKAEFAKVVNLINDKEIARLVKNYSRNGNKELSAKISEKFGINMLVPLDTEVAVEKENFLWIKRERVKYLGNSPHDITQGFMIYRYPYSGADDFGHEAVLQKRDSILKKYVPGPRNGTYMTTEYRYPPESFETTVDGKYGLYTSGLWRTENYFMGGPFRKLTTTSADGNYIITVSGFVFAPKFDKREFAREIEAVLSSFKFQPEAQANSGD